MKEIIIPINGEETTIQSEQSFVIVGANGSGKSHLGAWIEKSRNQTCLRVSAQRALTINEHIAIKSEAVSFHKMMYGNENFNDWAERKTDKWGTDNYTTSLVNDYDSVVSGIFARNHRENEQYIKICRECEKKRVPKPDTPETIVIKINDIWNSVFPQRKLILEDSSVKASTELKIYHGKDMSDGERVALYLIGQCLLSPDGYTIVVDEPEIHLHKAIMHKLWDKIEEYCPENTFVYISHDLDFAASRKDAKKIWVKSYDKDNDIEKWDIQILDKNDVIPDDLMLEVLGNRKNVILVEGEKDSYDTQLYTYVYDDFYVIPCHNCYKVIELTKAFNEEKVKGLHSISVQGIIDRDYLTETEIKAYHEKGIYSLDVAEVENLYLLPEIQRIVAEHMAIENIPKTLEEVKNFLFKSFVEEKEVQITSICERELQFRLGRFHKKAYGLDALKSQYELLIESIDIEKMYNDVAGRINSILSENNLQELLKIYNRKSLHERVSGFFKLSKNEYPKLVLRLLKTDKRETIVNALKNNLPQIQ